MNDRIESALAALPKATPGPRTGLVAQNTADYVLALAAPDLASEVIRLREEVARLTEKLKSYQRAGESISQALNEGQGVYKP